MDAMNVLSTIMQDPEAMKKAMSIASMLSSSGALDGILSKAAESDPQNSEKSEPKALPPQIGEGERPKEQVSSISNGNNRVSMEQRLALLEAIRPYLSKDKASKLDSVIGILRLVSTLESSGIKLF